MSNINPNALICELSGAILNDSLLKVQKLVENENVEINYSNFMTAVDCEYTQILRYLLEKTKNPIDYASYSLCISAHIGRKNSIKTILDFLTENIEKFGKVNVDKMVIKAIQQATDIDVIRHIVNNYE